MHSYTIIMELYLRMYMYLFGKLMLTNISLLYSGSQILKIFKDPELLRVQLYISTTK